MESFVLFKIGPNDGGQYYRYTTLPYDYVSPLDGMTYSAQDRVIMADPPRVSDSLDRQEFKVTLADSDGSLRATLESWGMHGVPMSVYSGLINNTDAPIGGTPVGSPLPDLMVSYEGTVDTFSYVITPDEEILLTLEGTSPVGALDLRRTILTSKEYINQEYPTDTSYDRVFTSSRHITLLWGKR